MINISFVRHWIKLTGQAFGTIVIQVGNELKLITFAYLQNVSLSLTYYLSQASFLGLV